MIRRVRYRFTRSHRPRGKWRDHAIGDVTAVGPVNKETWRGIVAAVFGDPGVTLLRVEHSDGSCVEYTAERVGE